MNDFFLRVLKFETNTGSEIWMGDTLIPVRKGGGEKIVLLKVHFTVYFKIDANISFQNFTLNCDF